MTTRDNEMNPFNMTERLNRQSSIIWGPRFNILVTSWHSQLLQLYYCNWAIIHLNCSSLLLPGLLNSPQLQFNSSRAAALQSRLQPLQIPPRHTWPPFAAYFKPAVWHKTLKRRRQPHTSMSGSSFKHLFSAFSLHSATADHVTVPSLH